MQEYLIRRCFCFSQTLALALACALNPLPLFSPSTSTARLQNPAAAAAAAAAASAAALASVETKESLRKEYLETNVPPDDTIVNMQRTMLRTLGFSPDHGVECLNSFSKDFPDDEKLQLRLQQFMRW